MGANGGFMSTEFGGARSRDRNYGDRKSANVDKFEPVYLGKCQY